MYVSVTFLIIIFVYFICYIKAVKEKTSNLLTEYYIRKKLHDGDYKKFNAFFETIKKNITDLGCYQLDSVKHRIDETVIYCVSDGKKFRGLLAVKVYNNFTTKEEMNEEKFNACHAVGWFIEVVQAGFLIYDDIMDQSFTRRGKLCWYKYKDNGILALNDGSVLRMISKKLLKQYCSQFKCYLNILDLVMRISQATTFGQILDCLTTPEGKRPNFTLFTNCRYESIVKYKTSLYTFAMPIRMAMYLANIVDDEIHENTEQILLRIGHLFQAQDDYLDVYGNPNITGKIGTDIEDGKCTWIAVKAYQIMDAKQKQWFEQSYGRKDPISVRIVRKIFKKLEMQKEFAEFEENEYKEISKMIDDFEMRFKIGFSMLNKALNLIYKRQK